MLHRVGPARALEGKRRRDAADDARLGSHDPQQQRRWQADHDGFQHRAIELAPRHDVEGEEAGHPFPSTERRDLELARAERSGVELEGRVRGASVEPAEPHGGGFLVERAVHYRFHGLSFLVEVAVVILKGT